MKNQKQLDIHNYHPGNGFIHHYQTLVKDVMIPYQYDVLHDRAEGAEKSHVVENFIHAVQALEGKDTGDGFYGMVFQDSDAAKWLEAAAYSLNLDPDPDLEQKADQFIQQIAAAQDSDGYLNTYFTIKDREKRWTNLLEGHELYCSGHMMEAAVAYYEATGKDTLLNVMIRNMEHIYQHFITEKHPGFPGHPEIELALLRLYRVTNTPHALELAKHFIDLRGTDADYYTREIASRNWTVWGRLEDDPYYQQSYAPVREQTKATGHSVRAVYLYTAMADLASEINDPSLFHACQRLWDSIARQMYVTGGIGSTGIGEAFTTDYHLPNDTAYAETCASIGLIFFASCMLELDMDGRYGDVMEQAFYNTVLAGMQLDGKRFFYVNPLEVLPGISGVVATHLHDKPLRPSWYACACCPPNIARLITSIGKYAYSSNQTTNYCHLYADGDIQFDNQNLIRCQTGYPYDFTVRYQIISTNRTLAIRIPSWSLNYEILVNDQRITPDLQKGYAYIHDLKAGDQVTLRLDENPHFLYASPKIANDTGCVALQHGPLIYCFEGVDNQGDVLSLRIDDSAPILSCGYDPALLGGTEMLKVSAHRVSDCNSLYTLQKPEETACSAYAVPYYTWGNRGENQMRVWMPRI